MIENKRSNICLYQLFYLSLQYQKQNDMKKFIISVCVITMVVFGFMPNAYLRGFVIFVGIAVLLLYAITHIDKKAFTRFIDSL